MTSFDATFAAGGAFTASSAATGGNGPITVSEVPGKPGTYEVSGSHLYEQASDTLYPVTVTVIPSDAPWITATANNVSFDVFDVPLTASTTPNPISHVGSSPANALITAGSSTGTGSVKVASFVDGNPYATLANSEYSVSINWGDGTAAQSYSLIDGVGAPNPGDISISPETGTAQPTFDVDGRPRLRQSRHLPCDSDDHRSRWRPLPGSDGQHDGHEHDDHCRRRGPARPDELVDHARQSDYRAGYGRQRRRDHGSATTGKLTLAEFSDDNALPLSDFSGTINWGDGSTTNFTSASLTQVATPAGDTGIYFTVSGSHVYQHSDIVGDGGNPYSVTVTVNDNDGARRPTIRRERWKRPSRWSLPNSRRLARR